MAALVMVGAQSVRTSNLYPGARSSSGSRGGGSCWLGGAITPILGDIADRKAGRALKAAFLATEAQFRETIAARELDHDSVVPRSQIR